MPPAIDFAHPLIILSAPRSFSSIVCAMLGQHPGLHDLPETHLFQSDTLGDWFSRCEQENYPRADGLVRGVAQVCFKAQTEYTVQLAKGWLRRRRAGYSTGMVVEELAGQVYPARLVEKSPSTPYDLESMRRAYRLFPNAYFIHLVRHPRGYCASVLDYFDRLKRISGWLDAGKAPDWIRNLAYYDYAAQGVDLHHLDGLQRDPQRGWYDFNFRILMFLTSVPREQWTRLRGEDVLGDLERGLWRLMRLLRLAADDATIERMRHPEKSPYARFGPAGARYGTDIGFLERPSLRPTRTITDDLDGPLGWREDGGGFLSEVKQLARDLGYT